ncbi:hypothetical protein RRF57_005769 [Xylaria bambusicola]|uniref:Uncharacterized protein n=1 Tax=Xylaria bambusicola TaxID=326684 RepID=A0AAN7UMP8_9PEZI
MSLLSPHYHLQEVTRYDITIASIAFGFTLGFGVAANMDRIQEHRLESFPKRIYLDDMGRDSRVSRFRSHLLPVSVADNTSIVLHFLLQIIINRCRIVAHNEALVKKLKIGVAVLITAVNISVYNIWIPARLQISERYIHINNWWDRCEKVIYMIVDACLNIYFIRVVQRGLVRNGLIKYRGLVHFNMFIIGFSLSMDLLIITMMSLPNTFVKPSQIAHRKVNGIKSYMQFHPLAYIVKLNIELSMADLIGQIARSRDNNALNDVSLSPNGSHKLSRLRSRATSASGSIPLPTLRSFGFGGWNPRGSKAPSDGMDRITRPETVYTVNATADTDIESALHSSNDIYTTREFRVDYEDVAPGLHWDSNTASILRSECDDSSLLYKD